MGADGEISQRDLRLRSKDIMDSVQRGRTFIVTRGRQQIAALTPIPRDRHFVSRADFASRSRTAPVVEPGSFRDDQDAAYDTEINDRYAG